MVDTGGERDSRLYPTEEAAKEVIRSLTRKIAAEEGAAVTVGIALERYKLYLKDEKGNKETSITTTIIRLEQFFGERSAALGTITPARCQKLYEELSKRVKVDTHRNMLAEAKTFLGWCVRARLITKNPALDIVGTGKRRRGKEQLRIDEARRWMKEALALAEFGEAGALAALMALLMGMRASEIVSRLVRDVDDDGRLLWIPESKTEKGRRTVEVPEVLRELISDFAKGKSPEALLFGAKHTRHWPRAWVKRICAKAKVPKVTAHAMRGLHATLAEEAGITAHVVAQALGHESANTTHAHYTDPAAVAKAKQRRTLRVLAGGRRG